jgi:hypothetical protein
MDRLLPDLALKVVLSGLLDPAWGSFSRSTIVRFFVYGNDVRIGVGEGNIWQWEIDALRASPIRHEWFKVEQPPTIWVEGIKYVPGEKASGMPRGLIPVHRRDVHVFIGDSERVIFPAYRCFDINLGKGRIISIISPRTMVSDVVETIHPAFPKERYRGRISNVEVNVETLSGFLEKGYGIGILKRKGSLTVGDQMEGLPLLGKGDLRILLERLEEDFKALGQGVSNHSEEAWRMGNESSGRSLK